MANVGFRAPACPLLLWRCVRGGPLPYTTGTPDQDADQIDFPIRRSEDHIPNKSCYQTRGSGPIVILQLENVHSQNLGCSISLHLLSPKPCQPRGHWHNKATKPWREPCGNTVRGIDNTKRELAFRQLNSKSTCQFVLLEWIYYYKEFYYRVYNRCKLFICLDLIVKNSEITIERYFKWWTSTKLVWNM
jgi:hypothetical protein